MGVESLQTSGSGGGQVIGLSPTPPQSGLPNVFFGSTAFHIYTFNTFTLYTLHLIYYYPLLSPPRISEFLFIAVIDYILYRHARSENGHAVGRTRHAPGNLLVQLAIVSNLNSLGLHGHYLQWNTAEEEGVSSALATFLAESLQVEELAYW